MRRRAAGLILSLATAGSLASAAAPWSPKPFGVLLLGHGGSSQWNQAVEDIRKGLSSKFPIEVAFGMADTREIQRGLDRLTARKVKKVVVVPLFVSSHSEVMEQTKYVLGLREDPSREFMTAPHAHRGQSTAKRIQTKLPLALTSALDDHPLVAEVLSARAKEMSQAPGRESVVLVGHGPWKEEDNELWLRYLDRLGERVKQEGGFVSVRSATLRDDAPPEVRAKAEQALRKLVGELSRQGRVLVIPHLIAQGGVERKVRKSLDGMFYVWTGKTLLPDPRLVRWVELKAEEGAPLPDMRRFKDAGRALPPPDRKRPVQAGGGHHD